MYGFQQSSWMRMALGASCLLVGKASALDPAAEAAWKERAVVEFPELAVKDSGLNKRFVFMVKQLKEKAPQFFTDPNWPYRLAKAASANEWPPDVKMTERDPLHSKRLLSVCEVALKEGVRRKAITGDIKRFYETDGTLKLLVLPDLLELAVRYIPDTEDILEGLVRSVAMGGSTLTEGDAYWVTVVLARPELQKALEPAPNDRLRMTVQLLSALNEPSEVIAWISGGKAHNYNGSSIYYSQNAKEARFSVLNAIVQQRLQLGELHFTEEQIFELVMQVEHWGILFEMSMELWPGNLWADSHAPMQVANGMKGDDWKEYFQGLDALYKTALVPDQPQPAQINELTKPEKPEKPEKEKPKVELPKSKYAPGRLEECLLWRCVRFDSQAEAAAWLTKASLGLSSISDKNAHDAKRVFAAMAYYFKGSWKPVDSKAPVKK